MAGKTFDFQCKLGGMKKHFVTISQVSKFQVFVETNGCFLHRLVISNLWLKSDGFWGELSAVASPLISTCLRNRWKW